MNSKPEGVLNKIFRRSHAGLALVVASITDQQLEEALVNKMRRLNRKTKERLFSGYGPLSSFSAKIDLVYALELVDSEGYELLTAMRKVRNLFAHSSEVLNFDSVKIVAIFAPLRTPTDANLDNEKFFWELSSSYRRPSR